MLPSSPNAIFPVIAAVLSDDEHGQVEPRIRAMIFILMISLFGMGVSICCFLASECILAAVSFPALSKQIPFVRIPHLVFFIGKHFGTGISFN